MKHTRTASRILALVMALTMVFGLAASAYAADDAISAEVVIDIEDSAGIYAKIAFSVEEAALSIGAGMTGTTLDLVAYLSTQALVLESGLIEDAYGLDLTNLAENLENSVFNPNSGSTYALDEDTYNQILSIASGDAFSQGSGASELDTDALTDAANVLLPVVIQAGLSAASKVTATQSENVITINGEALSVSQTRIEGDNEAIIALWDSMLTSLESDTEVQSALAEIIDAYAAVSEEEVTVTGAEAVQNILDNMDEVRQSMTEEMSETVVTIAVTISTTDEETLVQAGVDVTVDDEPISVTVSISPEQDFFLLEIDEYAGTTAIQYAVTEDTDDEFAFRIGVYFDETETNAFTFQQDKDAQTFELGYISTEDDIDTTLSGYYESSEDLLSLTVDKVDGETFGGLITLNLRTNDTLTVPGFTEITSLTEEELDSIMMVLSTTMTILNQMVG